MRIQRLGEKAVILRDLSCEAYILAKSLNNAADKPPGVLEAVASYETVGVYLDDLSFSLDELEKWIQVHSVESSSLTAEVKKHIVPVCYEFGEDLESASLALVLTTEELIALHSIGEYECFAVGFSPGFAYLGYLDERISKLPRLATPRVRVLPGSVGITGRQTAVYPSATPGGWNLIGRCPLNLVDVADQYFPIEAGDKVEFRRIDSNEFHKLEGERL